jgi:hypothetical protein
MLPRTVHMFIGLIGSHSTAKRDKKQQEEQEEQRE